MLAKLKSRKYAIVDLEATSANSDAKIIQVGIVLVKDGEIYQTYTTDVNPHEELSPHIKNLTGITDEQLAKAPEFSQVARSIYELLEDAFFVAHNVKFDANLLAEALFFEGFEFRTPRVDTVELAQVLYPTLERYNLSYLAEVLDLDLDDAHTAIADAQATAQLFLRLQAKIANLPKLTVAKLLTLADNLIYETGQVLTEVYGQMPEASLDGYEQVLDLVLKPSRIYKEPRKLSHDMAHNLTLLGLDDRPQQLDFTQLIAQHLSDDKINFIEAQSGIGKTYGYLLPLLALAPNRKIIIATPTKILQDQIMASEGQMISETFHINFHNLKGYSNYIKLDSFWQTLDREESNRLVNRHKMQVLVWLTETETGDLDEIKQRHNYQAYFDEIRHDGELSTKSLFRQVDFWQGSYDKAQVSQVVLTNQAYLLIRMEDDPTFLEGAILVIDEAQKLLLNLESLSRRQALMSNLLLEVQQLHERKTDLVSRRLLERLEHQLSHVAESKPLMPLNQEAIALIRQDLSELALEDLPLLKEVFAETFDTFWLTTETFEERRLRWLHAGHVHFLDFKAMLPHTVKVYGVSATLDISPKVNLAQLLGFDKDHITFDRLRSVKQKNQAIWLPTDLPNITDLSERDYVHYLTEEISHLTDLQVPILVLFNSNQALRSVSEELDSLELPHLAQHVHGTATNVKKRFERGESQILLGSSAFWEGVDFAQFPKIMLVLTRLPFDNPRDPFTNKINQHLRLEGKDPFRDYHLPLSILRIKQAIGRTRRNLEQQSAVLVLDNRLLTKSYGKQVQRSLRQLCPIHQETSSASLEAISTFFQ